MTETTISEFISHPDFLGGDFSGPSWDAWRVTLKGAFGERMTKAERARFRELAERDPPAHRVRELWLAIGRRAGKDSVASAIACYLGVFGDFQRHLRRGERGVIVCLACDRGQAQIVFAYIRAFFEQVALLRPLAQRITDDTIELSAGVDIVVATNSFRGIRGRTIACAILDECAYWRDEASSSPDTELFAALSPAMATLRQAGALVIGISTVYRRSGLLFEKITQYEGVNDPDVLAIRRPSIAFNPLLSQADIDADIARDPERGAAEWLSEWRSDVGTYIARAIIEGAVVRGRHELPRVGSAQYLAFVDPSGGTSDSMTMAIAHIEGGRIIIDLVREARPQPTFSPETVIAEFSEVLRRYGISAVTGDRFAGAFPAELFRRHGIEYRLAELPTSAIYIEALAALNSGVVELLDHARLIAQLCGLERRTRATGKDTIAPPRGGHDDIANAVAGVITLCAAAASPSLWRRDGLLTEGVGIPMPQRIEVIFGVLAVAPRGEAAVLYWGLGLPGQSPALTLLDLEIGHLAPVLFDVILARLIGLAEECRSRGGALFYCPEALVAHAAAHGLPGQAVEKQRLPKPSALALGAAAHIAGGEVKVAVAVLDKSTLFPLGGLLDAGHDDADPVRVATLQAISLALDDVYALAA